MRQYNRGVLLVMTPLLLTTCKPDDVDFRALSCQPAAAKEIFDPFRHDVCLNDCSDAFDCPRGSICSREDEKQSGYCVVPGSDLQTSQRALLHGFAVEEMDAALITEDAYELQWTRPEGATLVSCVLLSCPPAFRIRTSGGEWRAPDDPRRVEIANFHNCAIASELSTRTEGSFNLRERDNQHIAVDVEGAPSDESAALGENVQACPDTAHGCAPVAELVAGCWAYGNSKILAATRLFTIDPRKIYAYHQVFALDGECGTDPDNLFRACVRESAPETEDMGTGTDTGDADTTDTGSDPTEEEPTPSPVDSPASHGLCSCAQPPCNTGDSDLMCMRPCLSDCDCAAEAQTNTCDRPETLRGVCIGETCTAIFGE